MALKISRILHAGYIFEHDQIQIAFDPIFENPFSKNCYAFPEIRFDLEKIKNLRLSAVFISHFHDDHCSLESLDLLDRDTPIYLYCIYDELFHWIKAVGFKYVHKLQIDQSVRVGALEITPRRALDAEVDSLFQIKADGLNILNVVDSWIDEPTLEKLVADGPWDLVLWPFQTMREVEVLAPSRSRSLTNEFPPEWEPQLKALNPKYIVPSSCQFQQESWSWYNRAFFSKTYRQFQEWISEILPDSKVIRLNPGVSIALSKASLDIAKPLSWITPIGPQDVDYDFDPETQPPPTSEISKKFASLSSDETEKVLNYCRSGLIEKYNALNPPEEPFFDRPRLWKLSVFDHEAKPQVFHYLVHRGVMRLASAEAHEFSWCTEVPISKLYGALELGESLTSMYMRINDVIFAPEVENELRDVDVIEDPLIRCLFSGVFGAYQRAQLERLKASRPEIDSSFDKDL